MASVTIRITEEARAALETLAEAKNQTVSDLLRAAIDQTLGAGTQFDTALDVPSFLSPAQRLLLAQQRETLATLADDDSEREEHTLAAEALREGFAGEYGNIFGYLEPELDLNQCQFLWDILDMFRVLKASIATFTEEEVTELGQLVSRAKFDGFDLSDPVEGRMLAYLRYLLRTDRWTEVRPRLDEIGDDGNSHSRRLPSYERMLAVFKPIWSEAVRRGDFGRDRWMSVDQVREITEARAARMPRRR
ncbi:YfbU family protein [Rhodococcus artemisiae]|uniref:YfbU family protein n=1 Tax=Rhodococcus artemisiae TaxID=714159 RepID=A0ABU7LL31_9NOCA|nr:YfbU family protein [Rhodococcus artemisiae]MEE2062271.1 YfbU family protein [Rhodococcus artemisiae]